MRDQVEKTIEVIRPALQADGGDIVLHDVDEATGVVTVELIGACVGCPASTQTLKAGHRADHARPGRRRHRSDQRRVTLADAPSLTPRRTATRPTLFAAARRGDRARQARLLSLIERGGEDAREVGRLAGPARRRRPTRSA